MRPLRVDYATSYDLSMFDLKIIGGTIVDGTGAPRFVGDIGIKDGVITAVARGGGLEGEAT